MNASVPFNLSATIQSIGSATAQLGSALAYSLMLTLIESFARNAYINLLSAAGLPQDAVSAKLAQLASIGETFPLVIPQAQQFQFLRGLDSFFKRAYVSGISQAMLALAGVCVLCAAVVCIGLRLKKVGNGG